jgi:hypothetical protein
MGTGTNVERGRRDYLKTDLFNGIGHHLPGRQQLRTAIQVGTADLSRRRRQWRGRADTRRSEP